MKKLKFELVFMFRESWIRTSVKNTVGLTISGLLALSHVLEVSLISAKHDDAQRYSGKTCHLSAA